MTERRLNVAVAFCRDCGSQKIDVNHWVERAGEWVPTIRCYDCGTHDRITLGRVILPAAVVREASEDRASYKRAPVPVCMDAMPGDVC